MSHIAGQGQHRSNSTRTNGAALIIVFVIVLAVALGIGAWFATHRTDGNGPAHAGVSDVALNKAKNTPKPVTEHHGNSPDCPDTDCIAMLVNGILGYKNGTPFSVGRHLRDTASAPVMISNDRILSNTATLLLMSRFDTSLGG